MPDMLDPRINGWLSQFFVWAVGVGFPAGFVFFCKIMWDVIKTQRDLKQEMSNGIIQTNTLIKAIQDDNDSIKRKIDAVVADQKLLKNRMVTWTFIRRLEMSLSAMSPEQRDSTLAKALRIEISTRETGNYKEEGCD